MTAFRSRCSGWMVAEMVIAVSIITILMIGMLVSLHNFSLLNRYQLLRHRCVAAGQAQLDAIAAGGPTISDEEIERLWPEAKVTVAESAGAGQWQGLRLVEVTARAVFSEKTIEVRLSRYLTAAVE